MLTRREFLIGGCALAFSRSFQKRQAFEGQAAFDRLLKLAHDRRWHQLPIGKCTGEVALALSGTPYVGGTLELSDNDEFCSVNLTGLDCVTLYETALGFARMLERGGASPDALVKEVQFTRYRGGKVAGYLSRLHYTSDWIFDNVAKGTVKDLTPNLPGAERLEKPIDFMGKHPDLYRQLKANPKLVPDLQKLEREITARKPFFVPNAGVEAVEPLLQTGDIVGIATSAEGLDCSHTGLVYVDGQGVRRFLNASSVKKEVVLGERLSEYALKYKRNLGVMIARPLEP